jgi:hypothetical protein
MPMQNTIHRIRKFFGVLGFRKVKSTFLLSRRHSYGQLVNVIVKCKWEFMIVVMLPNEQ